MPKKKRTLKEKRAQQRNIIIGVGIFLLVGVVVGVAFLVRLPAVTIAEVRVDGVSYIEESSVRAVVQEQLHGSYWWLIPRRNSLFFPEHVIEQELKATLFPIHLVDVTRDGFTKIVIAIEEREPVAVWCAQDASSSPCYLMDETGFLFQPGEENSALVMYRGGVSGEPLGAHMIDGEFPTLREVVAHMHAATNRSVEEVVVDDNDDIYIRFKEGGEVRFVRAYDEKVLLDNIASVFSSKRFETEEQFEYADFRFGNKVYVKFGGE